MSGDTSRTRETPPAVIADRYTVERLLGRGGMATVYLCTDSRTRAKVAVKVLRKELGSAVIVERFVREIEFASELDHPRVPKVLDSGVWGETPFYVMTYIEGESLRQKLDRVKQLPVDEAVSITAGVIEPMSYAHAQGIIHRDIKPGNILIGLDGVYVLDFGIARAILASAEDRLTSTGIALGTPAYMSPEQALADHDLDARSDIYSLACVTYEMIAGIPPFVGATPQAVMARRFASAPSPLRETREGVPEHVEFAVSRALSRAPADRWQTAKEFSDALSSPKFSESIQQARRHQDSRRRTYGRGIAATIGIVVLAAGTFAANVVRGDHVARAQRAIADWDLDRAERYLTSAAATRREDARIHLWLAQVMMLQERPSSEWAPKTVRAVDRRETLDSLEVLRLDALSALAASNYAEACRRFSTLVALERGSIRRDFTPSLALADCLHADSAVVADPASPSGFSFRSSYQQIDSLYHALLERHVDEPGAFDVIAPRLERILVVDRRKMRIGFVAGAGRKPMYAQPQLLNDTLAYVPYGLPASGASVRFGESRALEAAAARNLSRLRAVATRWTTIAPESPSSHEMLAKVLENAGELDGSEESALNQLIEARSFSMNTSNNSVEAFAQRVRLGDAHVRVLIRLEKYREASALADSILALEEPAPLSGPQSRSVTDVRWRLSALRGKVHRVIAIELPYAAEMKAYTPSGAENLPPLVARDAIALLNHAAFAESADSITTIAERLSERIDALVPPGTAGAVRLALMSRPFTIAAPIIGPGKLASLGESQDPITSAITAFARNDRRKAGSLLDSLAELHSDRAPGSISMDATYMEAWLRNAIGDTLTAAKLLDNAFRGISKAPPSMLGSPLLIASLVRSMRLRSTIAAQQGDVASERKWANAANALWGR